MESNQKICDICNFKTNTDDETVFYGDWQRLDTINVHYFCLLLSTNLPQKGVDNSGINGFLKRDIHAEITAAKQRRCCYCGKCSASVACWKCKAYFHLVCGHRNDCLYQFRDEFRSYCSECIPLDKFQKKAMKTPLTVNSTCYICKLPMPLYNPVKYIYAACCGNGYVHHKCMQKYALAAGYYLKCIWCKASSFREHVRLQGIFVPDRDAKWELEKGAYCDLHRGHKRCDMEPCLSTQGREYISKKWPLIICTLCGSFGAHNPKCIPGKSKSKVPVKQFKCETCSATELMIATKNQTLNATANSTQCYNDCIDTSIYMAKQTHTHKNDTQQLDETPTFSDSGSVSSSSSKVTVIPRSSPLDKTTNNIIGSNMAGILKLHPTTLQVIASNVACVDTNAACTQLTNEHNYSAKPMENTHTALKTLTLSNNIFEDCTPSPLELNSNIALNHNDNIASSAYSYTMPATGSLPNTETSQNLKKQSLSISATAQEDNDDDDFVTFDMLKFDDHFNCLGTSTIRIRMSDPRFVGKTLAEIIQNPDGLIEQEDVIKESNDIGIFKELDKIIAEYK